MDEEHLDDDDDATFAAVEDASRFAQEQYGDREFCSRNWQCVGGRGEFADPSDAEGRCTPCQRHARLSDAKRRRLAIDGAQIPARFAWASFESPELAKRVTDPTAIGLASQWSGDRMVLTGPAGAGKTTLAVCALRRSVMTQPGFDGLALFVSTFELVSARTASRYGSVPELLRMAQAATVLALDDLGAEPPDTQRTVAELIHGRFDRMRQTVVTTYCEPEDLARAYGGGVVRRVFEGALKIRVKKGS